MVRQHLLLKWGTLKGWNLEGNEAALELLRQYGDQGMCISAMAQRDTDEQKQILCNLIDAVNGPITNDWSGEDMSKDEAKKYVMEYGHHDG